MLDAAAAFEELLVRVLVDGGGAGDGIRRERNIPTEQDPRLYRQVVSRGDIGAAEEPA